MLDTLSLVHYLGEGHMAPREKSDGMDNDVADRARSRVRGNRAAMRWWLRNAVEDVSGW